MSSPRCAWRRARTSRPRGTSATTASTTGTPPARASTSCGIPLTPAQYRELGAFARLRHRFEWSFLGSGAYFLREVWWLKMWRYNAPGKRRSAIIRDKAVLTAAVVLVLGGTVALGAVTGGWLTAIWLPVKLFVVPFLLFVHIIGWTVYVHHVAPDIRWWPRKEWSQFRGQMESTTILRVPAVVNKLWFHNIFVHVPHHVDARIPFHKLPQAAAAIKEHYPHTVRSDRLSMRAVPAHHQGLQVVRLPEGHLVAVLGCPRLIAFCVSPRAGGPGPARPR